MAIHMMEINGKIANVVFYKMNGKNVARMAPRKAKRTKPMKLRNRNFGIASRSAGMIRKTIGKALPFPANRSMQSRFSGAIAKWIGSREVKNILPETGIAFLMDFGFNAKTSLRQRWKVSPYLANTNPGKLQLIVPAFIPVKTIIAPEATVSVELIFIVATTPLETGMRGQEFPLSITIPYNNVELPARSVDLPVNPKPGDIMVTVCALRYLINTKQGVEQVTDPNYLPSAVIDARYC